MRRNRLLLISAALLWTASSAAVACRLPGKVWPTSRELATTSQLVFVAHIDKVRPLAKSDEDVLRNPNPPVGVPFRFPTSKAEFTLVRSLKGDVPTQALLQGYSENCTGVELQAGRDYLIFADAPQTPGGDIAPIKGSFHIGMSATSRDALRDIESTLSSTSMTTTP